VQTFTASECSHILTWMHGLICTRTYVLNMSCVINVRKHVMYPLCARYLHAVHILTLSENVIHTMHGNMLCFPQKHCLNVQNSGLSVDINLHIYEVINIHTFLVLQGGTHRGHVISINMSLFPPTRRIVTCLQCAGHV
jgi:hypothetical protein